MPFINYINDHINDIRNYEQPAIRWREGKFAPHAAKAEATGGDFAEVLHVLPAALTREDVAACFREDPYRGFVAAVMWGGISRYLAEEIAQRNDRVSVLLKLDRLRELLLVEDLGGINEALATLARGGENYFYGIGPSYYTKLLYFLAYDMPLDVHPLIYDRFLQYAHCALQEVNLYTVNDEEDEIERTPHFPLGEVYMDYCRTLHETARECGIDRADRLESWLFGRPVNRGAQEDNPRYVASQEALRRCKREEMVYGLCRVLNCNIEEANALTDEFIGNGMDSVRKINERAAAGYAPGLPGCSTGNPFIIRNRETYVHLEYDMMITLFFARNLRSELEEQRIEFDGNRSIDILTFTVWSEGEETAKDTETYYFDVTEGYNAQDPSAL
jgi:hypothetical protein